MKTALSIAVALLVGLVIYLQFFDGRSDKLERQDGRKYIDSVKINNQNKAIQILFDSRIKIIKERDSIKEHRRQDSIAHQEVIKDLKNNTKAENDEIGKEYVNSDNDSISSLQLAELTINYNYCKESVFDFQAEINNLCKENTNLLATNYHQEEREAISVAALVDCQEAIEDCQEGREKDQKKAKRKNVITKVVAVVVVVVVVVASVVAPKYIK